MDEWHFIPGFPGYERTADFDRFRSWHKLGCRNGWADHPKEIYPGINHAGYKILQLRRTELAVTKTHTVFIHRLVLEHHVGRCPDGFEACHNNGVKTDNRIENLRWDDHASNISDKVIHGTNVYGSKHGMAKLTDEQVRSILLDSRSQETIGRAYGISQTQVGKIKRRVRWKHIYAHSAEGIFA